MDTLTTSCLCGAVTVTAEPSEKVLFSCHCSLCTGWSGGMQTGFATDAEKVTVEGPVKTFAATSFSERAWCAECGTALWMRGTEDGAAYDFLAGLFPQTKHWPLKNENYVDVAWDALKLPGEHLRFTKQVYEENCRHAEDRA